jgi:hypothetical protein
MSAVDKSGQCFGSIAFRVANLLSVSAASQLTDVHQSAYLQLLCNNMTAEARLAPIVASISIKLLLYKHKFTCTWPNRSLNSDKTIRFLARVRIATDNNACWSLITLLSQLIMANNLVSSVWAPSTKSEKHVCAVSNAARGDNAFAFLACSGADTQQYLRGGLSLGVAIAD